MANAKDATFAIRQQRAQVADAVLQGFLDSAIGSDLTTARNAGYVPGAFADSHVDTAAIQGVNR